MPGTLSQHFWASSGLCNVIKLMLCADILWLFEFRTTQSPGKTSKPWNGFESFPGFELFSPRTDTRFHWKSLSWLNHLSFQSISRAHVVSMAVLLTQSMLFSPATRCSCASHGTLLLLASRRLAFLQLTSQMKMLWWNLQALVFLQLRSPFKNETAARMNWDCNVSMINCATLITSYASANHSKHNTGMWKYESTYKDPRA